MSYRGGYWRFDKKETTSHYRELDVRMLNRDGALKPGNIATVSWSSGSSISVSAWHNYIKLIYNTLTDSYNYIVNLSWTECNYGGLRPWFICPQDECNKRVAILYGAKVFACRHCRNLAYDSQNESRSDREFKKMVGDRALELILKRDLDLIKNQN